MLVQLDWIRASHAWWKFSPTNRYLPYQAMSVDTVHQARNLVKRMRSDPKVNMKSHWKLVTYMIGGNDFCLDICYFPNQDKVLEKARNDLILALRILRENLPRTMVNVVLPPDVSILTRFTNKPDECKSLHYVECPCFFSLNHMKNRKRSMDTIRRWGENILPDMDNVMNYDLSLDGTNRLRRSQSFRSSMTEAILK